MKLRILACACACACAMLLGACSTLYKPLSLDEKTGMYPTSIQVDPGGVAAFDTSHDPKSYRYVVVISDSNFRPSVFAFTVRQALAQAGITRVFTSDEFMALARDRGYSSSTPQPGPELVGRFSREVGPVLVIDYSYRFIGNARFYSQLTVYDGPSGKALLKVDHPRINWADADAEAMYPVLNQLRKWMLDSAKGRA